MITPVQKDDELLADVAAAEVGDGFALWWLGQSGFLVKHRGGHVLFDPYLSDSLRRKYAGTDKPHERMTEIAVDPARLEFIDVVASSHNHGDHLDPGTLLPLLAANPAVQVVIPEANRVFVAERLRIAPERLIGLDDGTQTSVAGCEFHGIAAAHETVDCDPHGRCEYLGYVVRFGSYAIYHSGDTVLYDGLVDRLRPLKIDVALLPINGRVPVRGVLGNLSGPEAAELAHQIGARLAIPCHYDMFRFNTASPAPFIHRCRQLGQPYHILACGQQLHEQGVRTILRRNAEGGGQ